MFRDAGKFFHDVNDWGNKMIQHDIPDLIQSSSYSDMVSKANEYTDGWYSTIAGSLPIAGNLHRAMLGRDSAKDYLDENGMSWKDGQGYNIEKLVGSSSSNLGGAIATGGKWLKNAHNDLGKLYTME